MDHTVKSGKNGNVYHPSQHCRPELPPAFMPGSIHSLHLGIYGGKHPLSSPRHLCREASALSTSACMPGGIHSLHLGMHAGERPTSSSTYLASQFAMADMAASGPSRRAFTRRPLSLLDTGQLASYAALTTAAPSPAGPAALHALHPSPRKEREAGGEEPASPDIPP